MPKKAQKEAVDLREDVSWVYQRLGGREAMLRWAEENAKEFFKIYFSVSERKGPEGGGAAELVRALHELAEAEGE